MNKIIGAILIIACVTVSAQQKKTLDHTAYSEWKKIDNLSISRDGSWISYTLNSNASDNPILNIKTSNSTEILIYERGEKGTFTFSSDYLIFTIKPDLSESKELRRIKTKKEDLPKDSLAIFNLKENNLEKIPNLKSYKLPEKWSNWIVYQYEPEKDTSKSNKKSKKMNKENGYPLVIKNLGSGEQFEYDFVLNYGLSKKGGNIYLVTTGDDSTFLPGLYVFDTNDKIIQSVYREKGKYNSISWDEKGEQLCFVLDNDTTDALIRKWSLHYWEKSQDSSKTIISSNHKILSNQYIVNENYPNQFSKDGTKLFFGISNYPVIADTSLLEEEIVNVEVWSYTDSRLHTQQKVEKERDLKQSYTAVFHIANNQSVVLGDESLPEIQLGNEGNSSKALGIYNLPYQYLISWEGFPYYSDFFSVDVNTGEKKLIKSKVRASANISPIGKYAYWYDQIDTAWFTYNYKNDVINKITNNREVSFFNEIHDSPSYPGSYGMMSWTENDEKVLIYDRYDIWEVDPDNSVPPKKLTTNGRTDKISYRYIKLNNEERFVKKNQKLILRGFNETDKTDIIYEMAYKVGNQPKKLIDGPFIFRNIKKAQEGEGILFSKENFTTFPDIYFTKTFTEQTRISNANPQQNDYNWGTSELVRWTSLDGIELEGMLFKPENFDPTKKYPMIVNFYEKSTNSLNSHRSPSPGRSTINYSFYTSRGYLIFNPNVHYKTGYPGESAYNCVIPGVTSLIEKGFVDKENIGVQGHSWGGYQIAYLVTKTDIFKCAEAGAPVPNMTSAYGGIRWGSGLSRMFQYEHTQSRIGGTLWEYPKRYIENSPIFYVDKINTPVLIMHNDADTAVPWYQGIEFFVALRRLGKPSWLLNYQGEPHWPVKLQNRIDFNIRLAQFFDYYLKGDPMPSWMKNGVSAIDFSINQGLELIENEN